MDRLALSLRQALSFTAALLALSAAHSAVTVAPATKAHELIAQGDRFDAQLQTDPALQAYLAADQASPGNAEVLRKIAREYGLSMDDTKSADEQRLRAQRCLEYAQRAVEAGPEDAQAHLATAICYGRLASFVNQKTALEYSKQVKIHVDRSVALDPGNDYAYHVLGAWNYELASIGGIERAIARIIYGAVPRASYADAEKAFRQAVMLAPGRVSHHVELGRSLVALERRDEAIAELKRALALPNSEKDDPESKRRAIEALRQLHVD